MRSTAEDQPMNQAYQGDLHVDSEVTVTRTVRGKIVVHRGGALVLMGRAEDGLIVEAGGYARVPGATAGVFVARGGHAVITGSCEGDAVSDGGTLVVEGTLTGTAINLAVLEPTHQHRPITGDSAA